jgi:hypothetical protein
MQYLALIAGARRQRAEVIVGVNQFVVQTLSEIFGESLVGPGTVRLTSAVAVQVLGIDVDIAGAARPRLPF